MVIVIFCSICQRCLKISPNLSLAGNEAGPTRVSLPTHTWVTRMEVGCLMIPELFNPDCTASKWQTEGAAKEGLLNPCLHVCVYSDPVSSTLWFLSYPSRAMSALRSPVVHAELMAWAWRLSELAPLFWGRGWSGSSLSGMCWLFHRTSGALHLNSQCHRVNEGCSCGFRESPTPQKSVATSQNLLRSGSLK